MFLLVSGSLWAISLLSCVIAGLRSGDWNTSFQSLLLPNYFFDFYCYLPRIGKMHTVAFFSDPNTFSWTYPAPCALIYKLLYHFVPARAHADTFILSRDASFLNPLTLSALSFLIVGVVRFVRALRSAGLSVVAASLFGVLSILFSWPIFFDLERGNIEILLWVPLFAGIWALERRHFTIAALLIGFGASFKLYPVVLLSLLISERRFRDLALGAFAFLATTVAALAWLGPSFSFALRATAAAISKFTLAYTYIYDRQVIGFDHSLFSLVKSVLRHSSPGTLKSAADWCTLLAGMLTLFVFFKYVIRRPRANQVLFVVVAAVSLSPTSFDYTLVGIYAPFVLLSLALVTRTELTEQFRRWSVLTMVCFAIVLGPEIFLAHHGRQFGGQVKAICLIALAVIAAAVPITESMSQSAASARAPKARIPGFYATRLLSLLSQSRNAVPESAAMPSAPNRKLTRYA